MPFLFPILHYLWSIYFVEERCLTKYFQSSEFLVNVGAEVIVSICNLSSLSQCYFFHFTTCNLQLATECIYHFIIVLAVHIFVYFLRKRIYTGNSERSCRSAIFSLLVLTIYLHKNAKYVSFLLFAQKSYWTNSSIYPLLLAQIDSNAAIQMSPLFIFRYTAHIFEQNGCVHRHLATQAACTGMYQYFW
jgi:hypothetical protein